MRLLLRPKLLSLKNSLTRRAVIRRLPFISLGLLFWCLLYAVTYWGLTYIRDIPVLGDVLSARLLSMAFFTLTGFLLLSNVIAAVSSFYLSRDLPFLRSKPLKVKDVLALKTFETVLNSSWMVAGFMPPVLFAFGAACGAPASYYPVLIALFIFFILINSALGITAAHLLSRFFTAKRLRDIFLFSGLVLFLVAYFALRSSMPENIKNPIELVEAIMGFKADYPLTPGFWISESAISMLGGRGVDPLYVALLVSSGAFFLMVSFSAGTRFYGENTERMASAGERGARPARKGFQPAARHALLDKDLRLFFRDTGQWSQLLIILALAAIYVYNFRSLPLDFISDLIPFSKELLVLVNMLMAGLVLSAVAARFLYSSVSIEGRAFWIIKTSPLDMERFLIGKFIYGSVPVTALTLLIVWVSNLMLGADGLLMTVSLTTVFLFSVSISGLGTGLGALHPDFKYENIAAVSMSLGAMAFMLSAFSVASLTVMLAALPFYEYVQTGRPAWPVTIISAALIFALNFLAFYLPMRAGIKRLRDMEW